MRSRWGAHGRDCFTGRVMETKITPPSLPPLVPEFELTGELIPYDTPEEEHEAAVKLYNLLLDMLEQIERRKISGAQKTDNRSETG